MSDLTARYNPTDVEDKWYQYWEEHGFFHSEPDEREAYSIVIPPPNVTGVLHMGHMLNISVQDILIRKARLDGKNACWVPGTDHASIATEAKVVRMLREQGIKKSDLTREEFLEHAWAWTDKYGGIILKQLRKLGASCDWERTAFTLDEPRSEAVIQAFIDLYNREKLYRDYRMVNWDPEGQTVLSNEEVLYKDENTKLCHVRYQVEGTDEYVVIATTRPETIMGDSAVAVHPEDERYAHLKGKNVIVPIVNRVVPLIFDDYVEREFGTGALKVTPAHDPNDYEIGKRHKLETIDVLNPNGTLSDAAQVYIGEDRTIARKKIIKDLEASGQLVKVEDYLHSVGRSERTNAVVEPRLSLQWYVDMKALAAPALEAVMSDDIEFFPKQQKNIYNHWMTNIRDWCISRQLWWGHRIPVYYVGEEIFVAQSREEALSQAQTKLGAHISDADLRQDEDVLDTWFSSWLWPITCFNGFQDKKELDYYFPTSILVTGWDIIFLWVARMIMSGYEWEGDKAFKEVYFTGMVRDQQRRKMSKQLGNSPDALELIAKFGADGVRFGVLSSSPAGGDLLFDDKLCEQGRNFCNKMWNGLRLLKGLEIDQNLEQPPENAYATQWIQSRLNEILVETNKDYTQYRLSDVTIKLYSFVWNDFFSWYLEMIKPAYGAPVDPKTLEEALSVYEQICILLHPLMPFITEEIWHQIRAREETEVCMLASYPKVTIIDATLLRNVESLKSLVSKIREVRNAKQLKPKEMLTLHVEQAVSNLISESGIAQLIKKMAFLSEIHISETLPSDGSSLLSDNEKYFLQYALEIDPEEERIRIESDLKYARGFVLSVKKKLTNESFVNNAPEAVVNNERKKLEDGKERVRFLEENLENLLN
ncbi:MAG: valyl-tRNA synthetase [Saprospiraceae bacterium]|jgi:valyl-tRNA synthetase